jgi:hypothetical protein
MSGRTNPYDIENVRGYPSALQIYRIEASKFWQVRLFEPASHLALIIRSKDSMLLRARDVDAADIGC